MKLRKFAIQEQLINKIYYVIYCAVTKRNN